MRQTRSASLQEYACHNPRPNVVGIALLVVGVVLIIFGMQASASLGSRLSELFTGAPSDRTLWLLLVGVVALLGDLVWQIVDVDERVEHERQPHQQDDERQVIQEHGCAPR